MTNLIDESITEPLFHVQLIGDNSTVRSSTDMRTPANVQPNPCLYCIFCDRGNHSSHECERFRNSGQFWEKVSLDRRCKNCLRMFHRSNKCYDRSFCVLNGCRRYDKHSPILCHARFVKYYRNSNGQNGYYKRDSRFNGISSPHQTLWYRKINKKFQPNKHILEHSPNHEFSHRKINPFKFKGDQSSNFRLKSASSQTQMFQPQSSPVRVPLERVNMSTQTSEFENPKNITTKTSYSKSCQTDNCMVDVSVQTRVFIPPSDHIYNNIPPGMVDNVDVFSIGYVIKKDKMKNSNSTKMDEKLSSCNSKGDVRIAHGDSTRKIDTTTEKYSSTDNYCVTGNTCVPSTQSSIDPFISLTDVVTKAKYQAMKGFRNFPHWK